MDKGGTSGKKLAVRSQSNQLQDRCIRLAVDQEQVRFQVTFSMIAPAAREGMIAKPLGEWLVLCQKRDDMGNDGVEVRAMSATLFPLEISSEGGGGLNPPH